MMGAPGPAAPIATPALRQLQENECGAVALAIVLGHYGAWVPLPELRRACRVGPHGTNAAHLLAAAKAQGLTIRALRLDAAATAQIAPPAILFWEQNHFVVLEGVEGDAVLINDPARGRRRLTRDAFAAAYSGVSMPVRPGDGFAPRGTPPNVVDRLRATLHPAWGWVAALAAAAAIEGLALVAAAFALGQIVDVTLADTSRSWTPLVGALAAMALARAGQTVLADRTIRAMAGREARRQLDAMGTVPVEFIRLRQPAALAGRLRLAEHPATVATDVAGAGARLLAALTLFLVLAVITAPVAGLTMVLLLAVLGWVAWAVTTDFPANPAMTSFQHRMALTGSRQRRRIATNGEHRAALGRAMTGDVEVAGAKSRRWVDAAVGAAVLLTPLVAFASGGIDIGAAIALALAGWVLLRLFEAPARFGRHATALPETLAALEDAPAERTWAATQGEPA